MKTIKLKPETIVEETQRESIVNRPHNLAGSVKLVTKERFKITPEKVELVETSTVPALMKLFMEALDNPIDVAIKGGCNKIDVKVTPNSITVEDNGYGISSSKDENGEYTLYKAMCKYNTSSNYTDQKGQGQKGVNGIGIKLCTTLSTYFKAVSDDGKRKITVIAKDNNFEHEVKDDASSGETGVTITFKPDFKIFDVKEINQEHIDRMFEYTLVQALTYPEIQFRFNGKQVKYTPKKFLELFSAEAVTETQENYFFAILPNQLDDFRQLSFINGLETYKGGSHINFIIDKIVSGIRDKLIKKYKTIKPGDIKNKLQLVLIGRNMKNIDWEGQTKDEIATPTKNLSEYFIGTDFDKIVNKILKTPEIIDIITEVYKIKEELKKRQELSKMDKVKKKPQSEKFMPPIGEWTNVFLAEGDSASNSISKILGREGNGFFAMFGVPPNAYDMKISEIIDSQKMKELQEIIGLKFSTKVQDDINFKNIIITTDFDLPGHFIAGQLLGLFFKFGPNLFAEGRIKRFITPLILVTKNDKIITWFYDFEKYQEYEAKNQDKKYHYDYKKGLGSWDVEELDVVIAKDGLENMLEVFSIDTDAAATVDNWLNKKCADTRKEMLEGFEFNIMAS